ncbi:unnamed protein product [Strongylus vulgaris]|uniref:Uncharacterized protein n=1 Tax=Strongylus vulgaris TaxID=40348 RepID=A0A3P7IMR4_STRVU|nr:unnamed protein product [Strongylus vulgaris]
MVKGSRDYKRACRMDPGAAARFGGPGNSNTAEWKRMQNVVEAASSGEFARLLKAWHTQTETNRHTTHHTCMRSTKTASIRRAADFRSQELGESRVGRVSGCCCCVYAVD